MSALPEIPPLGRLELYATLGLVQLMEPDTEILMRERAAAALIDDEFDSPHAMAWFKSFHASEAPLEPLDACERYLLYRMMNLPSTEIMPPWVTTTGTVGKAGELDVVDAWYKGGRMLGVPEGADVDWSRMPPRLLDDDGQPLPIRQLAFKIPDVWMTASTDLACLKPGWTKAHMIEIKCKADDVLDEMISGITKDGRRLDKPRGPDANHVKQLRATLGAAQTYDWGTVVVCEHCWRIAGWSRYPDLYNVERAGGEDPSYANTPMPAPWSDHFWHCPWCRAYDPVFIDLQPPTCGEIYYWSRSWPRKTKSFFIEHDQAYFDRGLEVLASARQNFIDGVLPPRPDHFQWSVGPCSNCKHKPFCRLDSGLLPRKRKPIQSMIVDRLEKSNGITFAKFLRSRYDLSSVRDRVLKAWS